jgi:hypothetical protein
MRLFPMASTSVREQGVEEREGFAAVRPCLKHSAEQAT